MFFSLSSPNLPLQFKPFSHHSLLSRNRSVLGHLSNAGELGSHTSGCFSVGQIIKFLLAFSLGPIFEAFNYFRFYKDCPVDFLLVCHIPPTVDHLNLKGFPINLPLGQNYPAVFASHTGFHLTSTDACNFGDSLSSCLEEFGLIFSLIWVRDMGSRSSCCFGELIWNIQVGKGHISLLGVAHLGTQSGMWQWSLSFAHVMGWIMFP